MTKKTTKVEDIKVEETIDEVKDTPKQTKGTFEERLDDAFERLDTVLVNAISDKKKEWQKGYLSGLCIGAAGVSLGLVIGTQINKRLESGG